MKLYVARHGQSEANKVGIMSGSQDDTPLSEEGWADAAKLAQKLVGFKGKIVSSPLHRALQTAEYVRDQILPGSPIRVDDAFAERDMGNATDKPRDEYERMEQADAVIAGAETPEAMFERIRRGLETIKQTGEDTLLLAHGQTFRMLVCVLEHRSPHQYITVKLPKNGEVHHFEI